MSRTKDRLDCDTGYTDGQIFISALDGTLTSGTGTATRTASGNYGLSLGNSITAVLVLPLSSLILRYGVQDFLQEQFGSTTAIGAAGKAVGGITTATTASFVAGTSVNVAVLSSVGFTVGGAVLIDTVASGVQEKAFISAIPDATHLTFNLIANSHSSTCWVTHNLFTTPADVTGIPPYAGISQLTPVTSPRPKGITIKEIYPVYSVAGAALTTNTIGVTKTVINPSNVAPTITNILASAANGLSTATNAQPYITPIQVPIANAIYLNSKYTELYMEWAVSTAGGGTAVLNGVFVDITYNYN